MKKNMKRMLAFVMAFVMMFSMAAGTVIDAKAAMTVIWNMSLSTSSLGSEGGTVTVSVSGEDLGENIWYQVRCKGSDMVYSVVQETTTAATTSSTAAEFTVEIPANTTGEELTYQIRVNESEPGMYWSKSATLTVAAGSGGGGETPSPEFDNTVFTIKVVDTDENPVSNVSLYLKGAQDYTGGNSYDVEIPGTTDAEGKLVCDVSELDEAYSELDYELTLAEGSEYESETPVTLWFGEDDDWNLFLEYVGDDEYTEEYGDIVFVVNKVASETPDPEPEPVVDKTKLSIKVVDEDGNPVNDCGFAVADTSWGGAGYDGTAKKPVDGVLTVTTPDAFATSGEIRVHSNSSSAYAATPEKFVFTCENGEFKTVDGKDYTGTEEFTFVLKAAEPSISYTSLIGANKLTAEGGTLELGVSGVNLKSTPAVTILLNGEVVENVQVEEQDGNPQYGMYWFNIIVPANDVAEAKEYTVRASITADSTEYVDKKFTLPAGEVTEPDPEPTFDNTVFTIKVVDTDENPVSNVSLYLKGAQDYTGGNSYDVEIPGTTDAEGKLVCDVSELDGAYSELDYELALAEGSEYESESETPVTLWFGEDDDWNLFLEYVGDDEYTEEYGDIVFVVNKVASETPDPEPEPVVDKTKLSIKVVDEDGNPVNDCGFAVADTSWGGAGYDGTAKKPVDGILTVTTPDQFATSGQIRVHSSSKAAYTADPATIDFTCKDGEFLTVGENDYTGQELTITVTAAPSSVTNVTLIGGNKLTNEGGKVELGVSGVNLKAVPVVQILLNGEVTDEVQVAEQPGNPFYGMYWFDLTVPANATAEEKVYTVRVSVDADSEEYKEGTITLPAGEGEVETPLDTKELEDEIFFAESKKAEDYTPETFQALTEALTAAKAVLADEEADQAAVDAAAKALKDARLALVEAEKVPVCDESTIRIQVVDEDGNKVTEQIEFARYVGSSKGKAFSRDGVMEYILVPDDAYAKTIKFAYEGENIVIDGIEYEVTPAEHVFTVDEDVDGTVLTHINGVALEGTMEVKFVLKKVASDPEPVSPFEDVETDAYYYDAVVWAVENGVTTGKTATTFLPNAGCTRAQIVTFLWRANGCPEPKTTENPFTDVKEGAYYYDAVLWAVENGITTGKTATTFLPNAGCTRSQAVTFLWRAEGKPAALTENPFTDVKEGAYYYDAVLWAVENEITTGKTATTFEPDSSCARAQIVTFLYKAIGK